VKKPLKGLKTACYYGCALVRHPKITQLDDPENPQYLDRLMKSLGAEPVEWSYKTDCCGADLAMTYSDVVKKLVEGLYPWQRRQGRNVSLPPAVSVK